MNHYNIYMFDIPYVHVSVNADCKFSLVCMQNLMCTQNVLGSLMETGSVLHLIRVYHHEIHFRKGIMLLIFKCILENQERSYIQVSLGIAEYKNFSENLIGIKKCLVYYSTQTWFLRGIDRR